jgi:hypothetical protein
MIFFLIAGTATPAFLLTGRGTFGLASLIAMWTLTLAAGGIHLAWMSAPELLVGATFVGLGWAAGLALPEVWIHAGLAPGVLMLAVACSTRPERFATIVAGPTRPRPCSATTRSSTPVSAPPRPASTSR